MRTTNIAVPMIELQVMRTTNIAVPMIQSQAMRTTNIAVPTIELQTMRTTNSAVQYYQSYIRLKVIHFHTMTNTIIESVKQRVCNRK